MKKIIIPLSLLFQFLSYAQVENEFVDFSKIKKVLKKDGLDEEARIKLEKEKEKKAAKVKEMQSKYNLPVRSEFWDFATELWLVKNAPVLKWDIKKPDYGVNAYFSQFLNKYGHFGVKFRVLYTESPNVTHMALPSSENQFTFLISVPFIRTMDLTKAEISLLMFEDYLRIKNEYFIKKIEDKALKEFFGTNYYGKKLDKEILKKVLAKYDEVIWDKGFEVSEQYTVTKSMESYLRNDLELWNRYMDLLSKIQTLVKTNILYKGYNKIYPSPELQIKWLSPKKKVL